MTASHMPFTVGRYILHRQIARGGMASIHIARLVGDVGFSRIVAAKRMHPELAEDRELFTMFLDEARIASKVHHRNVVHVLDVVTLGDEVLLVQEYVHGAPLSVLLHAAMDAGAHVPVPVAAAIACQILAGLHATHEAVDELGTPLRIVHRDVSPQNIVIGVDGTARLLDFGVAKAALSTQETRKGLFKGKLGYAAPEQLRGQACRQSDIHALGIVLWELLAGRRLHDTTQGDGPLIASIFEGTIPTITEALAEQRPWIGAYRWSQLEAIEPVLRKALERDVARRWATAADMEDALAAVVPLAPATDVAAWLRAVGKEFLAEREHLLAEEESRWRREGATRTHTLGLSDGVPAAVPAVVATDSAPVVSSPVTTRSRRSLHTRARRRRRSAPLVALLLFCVVGVATWAVRDRDAVTTTPSPPLAPPMPVVELAPAPAVPADLSRADARPPIDAASPPAPAARPRGGRPVTSSARPATGQPRPRPAPARAPTLDCTTPFYFEGTKKIFKPDCL